MLPQLQVFLDLSVKFFSEDQSLFTIASIGAVEKTKEELTSEYSFKICFHPFCMSVKGLLPQSSVMASVKSKRI